MKYAHIVIGLAAVLSMIMSCYRYFVAGEGIVESEYFQTALLFIIIGLQLENKKANWI